MNKKLLITILIFSSWPILGAIKPSTHSSLVNDLYFNYQWALENSGQVVVGDLDDITPIETKGLPWAQIDWHPHLDLMFKRDTVVAIIDSGVDLEHEDLKGRIYLNEKECRDGRVPLGPTGDPDNNGYEGDCAGWNFATKDVRRQRLADDDVGHGTHVAGIIAANMNNAIGLAGLSNRIKILPLKVYDVREGQLAGQEVISLRVARAIHYAISRKVDVINLSLGWPIVANLNEVKEAIKTAEQAGVLVVAAAGNDRHEAQIYPCAFQSVFCVGSINVDGEMSRFSNFGGHVDILAPGGQILGLIPMTHSSDFFGMKGYDIKFGTSQAAPYVAGAAAILKGIFPEASNEEIRSALMITAQKVPATASGLAVFSASGLVQVQKAVEFLKSKKVLKGRPILKEWDRLVLDEKSLKGEYELSFVNGENLTEKDVKVSTDSSLVEVKGSWINKKLKLTFKLLDEWASANLKIKIQVKNDVYEHQVLLVKNIKDNKKIFVSERPGLLSKLQTIPSPTQVNGSPRFFYFDKEVKKLFIYALENGTVTLKFAISLPEIDLILDGIGIQRLDINLDGKLDYWVSAVVLDQEGRAQDLRYVFFDDEGQLINQGLHQQFHSLKFSSAYVLPLPQQSRMVEINHPQWGIIYVPVFLGHGPLEPQDQSSDAFDPNPSLPGMHLHYLIPVEERGEIIWKARSFTRSSLQKKMRSILGLPSWEKFDFLALRLSEESKRGEIEVLFRRGSGIIQDYYHLKLSGEELLQSALTAPSFSPEALVITPFYSKLDFSNQAFDTALVVTDNGEISRQTILKGQFSKNRMRSLLLGSEKVEDQYSYKTQDPREFIASLIKEYHYSSKAIRFYELDTTLEVVVSSENRTSTFSAPLYRTSFIQGSMFSLRFNPMFSYSQEGEMVPSLFVDNSSLFSPTFYMWLVTDEQVYVPVKHSFEIPQECQAMNPVLMEKRPYAVLFCQGQKGTERVELVAF